MEVDGETKVCTVMMMRGGKCPIPHLHSLFFRCHGKWRRVFEMSDCPCKNGADFIFV